jgi:type III secretion system FlhB-like substrate exporter
MMGINPILDSLLTQGIRGTGAGRPLQVNSTLGNEAVRELHSDSRLNDSGSKYAKVKEAYLSRPAPPSPSTVTTLNEAARTIADVLMKFPQGAAAPFLRLNPLTIAQLVWPETITQHLRTQVVSSGLFYESHLERWLNGSYALDDLKVEPQYKGFAGADQSQSSYAMPPGQRLVSAEDRQHYMIRHQLELLSHANLRLEGLLAPGYATTILVQRSYDGLIQDQSKPEDRDEAKPETWHGLMRLEHASFTYMDYEVQISGDTIHVRLIGVSALLQEYFRRDEAHFRERFSSYGLPKARFFRRLVTRVSERQPLKLPQPSTANAYAKPTHSAFHNEYGHHAERVRDHALQRGVAVNMGPELLSLLMQLDMDKTMPEALFKVFGDIVAWTATQTLYLGHESSLVD